MSVRMGVGKVEPENSGIKFILSLMKSLLSDI